MEIMIATVVSIGLAVVGLVFWTATSAPSMPDSEALLNNGRRDLVAVREPVALGVRPRRENPRASVMG